ncbi:MAG: MBL fold metallo-hydrolase, partial [Cellulomonas sp.]
HGLSDHSGGARAFAEMTKAPVRALDPAHRLGEEGLADGDVVTAGDVELRVLGTPGHSFDSLCFWLPADRAVLTGDTILGRGTTVIAPDGDLADYLRSLDRLRASAELAGADLLLPGHGPILPDPIGKLDEYIAHRRQRLDQIRQAIRDGARDTKEIVRMVYADVDESVWPAAEWSVAAQLNYLKTL